LPEFRKGILKLPEFRSKKIILPQQFRSKNYFILPQSHSKKSFSHNLCSGSVRFLRYSHMAIQASLLPASQDAGNRITL
jgi:hypothetical protein